MSQRLRSPEVMLSIDTSSAYGRDLVDGIGRYAAEHGPWSIYHEDRGLFDPLPPSLKGWRVFLRGKPTFEDMGALVRSSNTDSTTVDSSP